MAKKKNKNAHVSVTISLTKQIWLAIVQGQSWPSLWYVNTESFERDFRLSPMLANGTHGEVIESQGTRKASLGRIFCHLTWQEGKKKKKREKFAGCVRQTLIHQQKLSLPLLFLQFFSVLPGREHQYKWPGEEARLHKCWGPLSGCSDPHLYKKKSKASEFLNQLTGHQSPGTQRVWKGSRRVKTNKQLQVTASFKLLMY